MEKQGFVYIMSNKHKTAIYVGVTSSLEDRVLQHKAGLSSFTERYNLFDLVYFERIIGMDKAIAREKQLKNWHKEWKWNLIREQNPELTDLAKDWFTTQEIDEYRRYSKGVE